MLLMRITALVLIGLALMAAGADGLFWLETRVLSPHSLAEMLAIFCGVPTTALDTFLADLPSFLGAPLKQLLDLWAIAALGLPGVILAFIVGSRRTRR